MSDGLFGDFAQSASDLGARAAKHFTPQAIARTVGSTARSGLQGAHVTKQDLKDELHFAEEGVGVVTLGVVALAIGGLLVWWKVK